MKGVSFRNPSDISRHMKGMALVSMESSARSMASNSLNWLRFSVIPSQEWLTPEEKAKSATETIRKMATATTTSISVNLQQRLIPGPPL